MKLLLSQEQIATVELLWSSGELVTVICEAVGITRDTLTERLNRIYAPGANAETLTGPRDGGRGATFRMPRRTW